MSRWTAIDDFRRARRRANLERIVARLAGRSADLLSYDQVRQQLRAHNRKSRGLQDIPLDAIVGSVGRYSDFTRSFLPRQDSDEDRWARVKVAQTSMGGLPPIDVYQIGDVYFVRDGNHRVSVAREQEATRIQAYVTEVETQVPLSADIQPDDLILKAEYAAFLARTDLGTVRPQADLTVTAPGKYDRFIEHIDVHRHFMGLEHEREISYAEAVGHWYDEIYWPVIQLIRQRGMVHDFPDRTEADLYLWILDHRAALEDVLGWRVDTAEAAADLVSHHASSLRRVAARAGGKLLDAVTPDVLESGPPVGQWREERLAVRQADCLFADILVPVSADGSGWRALDQALEIARREGGRLFGLHIVAPDSPQDSLEARAVKSEFERRCQAAGVGATLVVDEGRVARTIAARSRWTDLVVVNLAHPPSPQPVARLGSGFRNLLLWSPRPVLAVPGPVSPFTSALLAYDGSAKAREALYIATHLACCWKMPLTVVQVLEESAEPPGALEEVSQYLDDHGVVAALVQKRGLVADAVLRVAEQKGCDLILMGGYGQSPLVEAVIGSAVDEVLRCSQWPVLVCR
jgi:nucleotide-binding universal stress UspA family protein